MKGRLLTLARNLWRHTVPVRVRTRAWELFARHYFERAALRQMVTRSRAEAIRQPETLQRLLAILEAHDYRPVTDIIREQLGLDFKGYSAQDLIAYLYFHGKPNGFFVDIGAYDGVEISNTWLLEQLGWSGICIEPIPEIFALLDRNRNCSKYNVAVSSLAAGEAGFVKVSERLGLSGLQQQMPERIRKGLEKQGLELEQVTVKTMTFGEIMRNHPQVGLVDFLSIDVEGAELDVLESIDFERFRFRLITIENNAGRAVLQDTLERRGYRLFLDLGVDLMFVPVNA
ncbi:MAG: FkbM family methyltransferase [Gammaproteobacteria bacterium]|nr:FkbM family methyltransferase [Pseudomonadales bacterium]MCP5349033.1 FkbM family methyltransferase [Pseudomonadales bacterium]